MRKMRFCALLGAFAVVPLASAQYQAVVLAPATGWGATQALGAGPGQQAGLAEDLSVNRYHAVLWFNSAASILDLHPSAFLDSQLLGTDGIYQSGYVTEGGMIRAGRWQGSAASFVNLHPYDHEWSIGYSVSGGQVAGMVVDGSTYNAALWTGPSSAWTNLSPGSTSVALGIGGSQQAGYFMSGGQPHAALWTGSAASLVDLTPAGMINAAARDTDGVNQVGEVMLPTSVRHAYLWSGTGASGVDLHPAGALQSWGYAVEGGKQAGIVQDPSGFTYAAVWSGTAASVVNLHQFLPPTPGSFSQATGIASDGSVTGWFYDGIAARAVVWVPTQVVVFGGFMEPINDPATPESVFKKGSTVMVRFKLTTPEGDPVSSQEAHISLTKLGAIEEVINEQYYITPADDGTAFRFNNGSGCYQYNLSTKNLDAGSRYRITATYGSGSSSVTIAIK